MLTVSQLSTTQGYGKMHEGRLFRFCSRDCLEQFEADPDKYIKGGVS
jgi:YHS domain-containing protein